MGWGASTGACWPSSSTRTGADQIFVWGWLYGLVTDEGLAFDSDTATGMMPVAHRVAVVLMSWRS
jgi:hypothetical protein